MDGVRSFFLKTIPIIDQTKQTKDKKRQNKAKLPREKENNHQTNWSKQKIETTYIKPNETNKNKRKPKTGKHLQQNVALFYNSPISGKKYYTTAFVD